MKVHFPLIVDCRRQGHTNVTGAFQIGIAIAVSVTNFTVAACHAGSTTVNIGFVDILYPVHAVKKGAMAGKDGTKRCHPFVVRRVTNASCQSAAIIFFRVVTQFLRHV
jgi:hypothetical protein